VELLAKAIGMFFFLDVAGSRFPKSLTYQRLMAVADPLHFV
jgi:hypothetical protein